MPRRGARRPRRGRRRRSEALMRRAASVASGAGVQPAEPVRRGHRGLARGLHAHQQQRVGRGADEHAALDRAQLARRQRIRRPCAGPARAPSAARRSSVVCAPGSGVTPRIAGEHGVGGLGPVQQAVGEVELGGERRLALLRHGRAVPPAIAATASAVSPAPSSASDASASSAVASAGTGKTRARVHVARVERRHELEHGRAELGVAGDEGALHGRRPAPAPAAARSAG